MVTSGATSQLSLHYGDLHLLNHRFAPPVRSLPDVRCSVLPSLWRFAPPVRRLPAVRSLPITISRASAMFDSAARLTDTY